ncbi:MAG TPA: hypothetical protein DFR83_06280 [Deltaproteobacteria bacterium]|nr:hypothetical protein [Deltaproteobacteria bacterium]
MFDHLVERIAKSLESQMSAPIVTGALAIAFGLFTGVARFVAPESALFSKLEPMKARFGAVGGTTLHVMAYTIMPLGFGVVQVLQGMAEGTP